MKRKRFSEEQIAFALRQADSGTTIEEICRKMGIDLTLDKSMLQDVLRKNW
jgi:putative transposase